MNVAEDYTLEREVDRLLREAHAHVGEYPAYSETDLRSKSRLRREVCESELLPRPAQTGRAGNDGDDGTVFESGIRLYDPQKPLPRSRVKPGYDILLLLVAYATELTPHERAAVEFTMAGFTLREIEQQTSVQTRTSSRDLGTAISAIRARRRELEQKYDLERTAKVLHLQSVYLPPPIRLRRLRLLSPDSTYMQKVARVMLGAVKPLLVPAERRCRCDRRTLNRLALELPRSSSKRVTSSAGRPRKVPAQALPEAL